jgi:hypothetical protein
MNLRSMASAGDEPVNSASALNSSGGLHLLRAVQIEQSLINHVEPANYTIIPSIVMALIRQLALFLPYNLTLISCLGGVMEFIY